MFKNNLQRGGAKIIVTRNRQCYISTVLIILTDLAIFNALGVTGFPKLDVFLENFRRGGGGSFPIQKITLQIFLVSKRYILVVNFGKNVQKGGRSSPIQKNSLQIYAS